MAGPSLETFTGSIYAVEGLTYNGNIAQNAARAQAVMQVAKNAGGGLVILPAGNGACILESGLVVPDGVFLYLPGGLTLKGASGLNANLISLNSNVNSGLFGEAILDGSLMAGGSLIALAATLDTIIRGLRLQNAKSNGINLNGCTSPDVADVEIDRAGAAGLYLHGTSYGRFPSLRVSNTQGAAGVLLDSAASYNVFPGLAAWDSQGTPTQTYPFQEAAASGCDYNVFSSQVFVGNATANLPQLVGAHSGSTTTGSFSNANLATPTISSPTLSGTVAGSPTFSGSPTFGTLNASTIDGAPIIPGATITNGTLSSPLVSNATVSNPTLEGPTFKLTTVTAGTTAAAATDALVMIDASGGNAVYSLPAALATGRAFLIFRKDGSANTANITAAGGDEIDGYASVALAASQLTGGTGVLLVDKQIGMWSHTWLGPALTTPTLASPVLSGIPTGFNSKVGSNFTSVSSSGNTQTLQSVTIPANTLSSGKAIRIRAWGTFPTSNTKILELYVGGTLVATITTSNNEVWAFDAVVGWIAHTSETSYTVGFGGQSVAALSSTPLTFDETSATDVHTYCQLQTSNGDIVSQGIVVEAVN